jgi:protein-disulfide isomerase
MHRVHHDRVLQVDTATDHILGPLSAPVTVIEYGDFASPACREAQAAVRILLREHGRHLRFVYRHFPQIETHPHAEAAAEASEAVGAQGHFWPFHELLFENQQHLKEKALRQYAERAGADLVRYDHEMRDRIYLQRVQEHLAGARHLGLRSLPAFYVNGALVDVSFGLERLDQAVAQVLKGQS